MDARASTSGDIDWDDPMFNAASAFDESMAAESPGYTAFDNFTNFNAAYADNANSLPLRNPSKSGPTAAGAQQHHQQQLNAMGGMLPAGVSAESSSQDSASDSSSRRKRKVTESPESQQSVEGIPGLKTEESMEMDQRHNAMQFYEQNLPTRPMHDLTLDHSQHHDAIGAPFNFSSAASSPVQARDFGMPMVARQAYMPASTMPGTYQHSPQTINPGAFQVLNRDPSPITHIAGSAMYNNPSPGAVFSTPSSDSDQTFNGGNQQWANGMSANANANPSWPNPLDFNNFNSPNGTGFTPSPRVNGATPAVSSSQHATSSVGPLGRSSLHIAPISTKSRVETQINVIMTLETPPSSVENVHLPLHTIAKSKLLAKDEYDPQKSLELHTMLVCTSAMNNPAFKAKALQRAAEQSNDDIQRRAELARAKAEEDEEGGKNDSKNVNANVDDAERPANGGEVRICSNCIQRERKRAGRKKLKKEEEQMHWERYETERVVVFNSNEYLPLKLVDRDGDSPGAMAGGGDKSYTPPEGAVQCAAAMRIACYCRHQQEKEGFQVIFTLKDQQGNVVAQQLSDSILITDDHKTHPPSFSTTMPGDMYYNPAYAPNGLPASHSMVDLAHMQGLQGGFTSSRSTGNLQAMAYGGQHHQQFNPHSHVHQLSNSHSGYGSQATSATMTPTSLSRPASPSSAGHAGPNKKRKSSSFHNRVPSGLVMTPARVDTNQPPSAGLPSALSVASPFSPTGDGFGGSQQGFMAIPNHNGPAQFFGSGPPTPSENHHPNPFFSQDTLNQAVARSSGSHNHQAYFSHPSSAVPSRSSSPVLQQQSRPNMAAYARHPQIQTPTNTMQARQAPYQQQYAQQQHQQREMAMQHHAQHQHVGNGGAPPGSAGGDQDMQPERVLPPPTITKILPIEGNVAGGTEVAIYGYNFANGMTVMFGDQVASATFYGAQALLATAPPSRPGGVNVSLIPPQGQQHQNGYVQLSGGRQIFTYTDCMDPRTAERELRILKQQLGMQQPGPQQLEGQQAVGWRPMGAQFAGNGPGGYQ